MPNLNGKDKRDDTLSNHNARAVRSALDNQNRKLDAFETKLKDMARSYAMLNADFQKLKEKSLQDIAARFDGGPTA